MVYLKELRNYLKDFPTIDSLDSEQAVEDDSAILRQQLEEFPTILHSWGKWKQFELKVK